MVAKNETDLIQMQGPKALKKPIFTKYYHSFITPFLTSALPMMEKNFVFYRGCLADDLQLGANYQCENSGNALYRL